MHEYFLKTRSSVESATNWTGKPIIPHFCGVNGTPKYPVTDDYAQHTIIVYKPWRQYPTKLNWIEEFENFIESSYCPPLAKMQYERVFKQHIDKMTFYKPKSTQADHSGNVPSDDDVELLELTGLHGNLDGCAAAVDIKAMERGIDFDWDSPPMVRKGPIFCKKNVGP